MHETNTTLMSSVRFSRTAISRIFLISPFFVSE
jgi:hypothetical protein